MSWFQLIGFVGVAFYLGGYAALQTGVLRGDGYAYAVVNGVGAACVLTGLMESFNLSSAIIQIAWIALSVFGIVRLYIINKRLRFTPEELQYLTQAMPDLSKVDARAFLNNALDINGEPGTQLTQQGQPIAHLIYLLDGEATVFSGGIEVATIKPGNYIGDVTYLLGEPATATVVLATPARYLSFEVETLREFLGRNATTRRMLEESAAENLRKKLSATTARQAEVAKADGPKVEAAE
ncbi:MAG: cyclic nucleotide-binding domain-containing protein [Pseudomonadota bacterium]